MGAGNPQLATDIVGTMASEFQVDKLGEIAESLEALVKNTRWKSGNAGLVSVATQLIEEAIQAERYDLADQCAAIGLEVARKTNNTKLEAMFSTRKEQIKQLHAEYDAVAIAKATLKEQPEDSQSNLVLGRYLCFTRDDWELGLKCLALSRDPALRTVAELEIKTPITAEERMVGLNGIRQSSPESEH